MALAPDVYLEPVRLSYAAIENITDILVKRAGLDPDATPRPVEDLLENFCGTHLEIIDLQTTLGRDVLGSYSWVDDTVSVDESLAPDDFPAMRGRYMFTVAHELGHVYLHGDHLKLFAKELRKHGSLILRRHAQRNWFEWQANIFASCILMPKEVIYRVWDEFGCDAWLAYNEECCRCTVEDSFTSPNNARDQRWDVRMAQRFDVSAQAMRHRLRYLHLI